MENFLINLRCLSRILVLSGPSGAGKSEISVNLALKLNQDKGVVLIDLDLIKPFFRLRNARSEIQNLKVRLITSAGEWDSTDLPVIPAEVNRWLLSPNRVIIDVGGEGQGARILKQYRDTLESQNSLVLFVANPYRPFSRTVQELKEQLESIQEHTGMSIKGIISNPHLKEFTDLEIIRTGHAIVEDFSKKSGLPILLLAVREDLVPLLTSSEIPLLPLKFFIRPPWEY